MYASSVGYNILLKADMFAIAGPMLESLKVYGITGPNAMLRLYYLSCKHTLQLKTDTSIPRKVVFSEAGKDTEGAVLSASCPKELLEYVHEFVSPAQWLYIAKLPSPHDDDKWNSWYLSRIISSQVFATHFIMHYFVRDFKILFLSYC